MKIDNRLNTAWLYEHGTQNYIDEINYSENNGVSMPEIKSIMDYITIMEYRYSEDEIYKYFNTEEENAWKKKLGFWSVAQDMRRTCSYIMLNNGCYEYNQYAMSDYSVWNKWIGGMPNCFIRQAAIQMIPSIETCIELLNCLFDDDKIESNLKCLCIIMHFQRMIEIGGQILRNITNINRNRENSTQDNKLTLWNLNKTQNELINQIELEFINLIKFDENQNFIILTSFFATIWLRDKKNTIVNQIRSNLVEVFSVHQLKKVIENLEEYSGKSALLYREWIYIEIKEKDTDFDKGAIIAKQLCEDIYEFRNKNNYIEYPLNAESDEEKLFWLHARMLFEVAHDGQSVIELYNKYYVRLDGWKYTYENMSHNIEMQFYYIIVSSMLFEWLVIFKKNEEASKLYLTIWDELIKTQRQWLNSFSSAAITAVINVWARFPLFVSVSELNENYPSMILNALEQMDEADMKISAVIYLIKNSKEKFILNDELKLNITKLIENEIHLMDKRERASKKNLIEKVEKILS